MARYEIMMPEDRARRDAAVFEAYLRGDSLSRICARHSISKGHMCSVLARDPRYKPRQRKNQGGNFHRSHLTSAEAVSRYVRSFQPDSAVIAHLRAGIAEFRRMLDERYPMPQMPMGPRPSRAVELARAANSLLVEA